MNAKLWKDIDNFIIQGKLDEAITRLESNLAACKSDRFKSLIGANFTNDPLQIANEINKFIASCERNFDVRSIYLEMNGFDINTKRWYFDFFAYDTYNEDQDDLDWLSDWDSRGWPKFTLVGLEETQKDFDWYSNAAGYEDILAKEAEEYAVLLVMVKFVRLIEAVVATRKIIKKVPILATAHDFDIIPRFMP